MESFTVSMPSRKVSVKIWGDDTIETVRMRIGLVTGMHPDRLRIYIEAEFPSDYYAKDSRKWEDVFLRLSPEGKPLQTPSTNLWAAYTDPPWEIEPTDKTGWMMFDPTRDTDFTELRVLGAPEDRSWILPLDASEPPMSPPPAKVTILGTSVFSSLHPYKVKGFRVIPHQEMPAVLESLYFPMLRSGSPAVVPEELTRSIVKQDQLLEVLDSRTSPQPTHQTILRARWKIPLVDSEFGKSVRNRFEQIFYGTTLTKTTPTLTFFGSKQEQSRHKFYTDSQPKKSSIDLRTHQYWWTAAKPTKNKPTILFFRGTSRFVYDRISINATEMVMSSHRADDSTETLDKLQSNLKEWVQSIDGLQSFLNTKDLDDSRWVLQDLSASLKYAHELKEGDFRRFGCLRGIYEIVDHDKLLFKFLRSDQVDLGLSPSELRVVQLLKDNETASPTEIADDLGISVYDATTFLESVKEKLEDNPDLLDKQYSNIPAFRFSASTAVVSYAIDLSRIAKYISILRDILMNPEDPSLDDVCPAKMETFEVAQAQLVPAEENADLDFLDELLGEIAEANVVAAPERQEAAPKQKKIATKGTTSLATYLLTQLREFDSETYDPDDPQILRKCDRPRQPIVLSTADMARLADGPYDPRSSGPSATLDVEGPDGTVICPAYWCTYDRIPLTEEQLGEEKVCPVCSGKVRAKDAATEKKQDIIEYPVLQRDSSIVFPGYVKYKSKKNNRPIPCCFTTAQTTKVGAPKAEKLTSAEAFYILGETKAKLGPLRLGYITRVVGKALDISLNYKDTIASGNRIQAGQAGFYKVGVGHPSETLPQIVGYAGAIKPPIQNVDATMRCSFFRTWRGADEDADEEIIPTNYTYRYRLAGRVASIDKAFKNKTLSVLEELEYSAIALECQLFVLYVTAESVDIGCFMNIGAVRSVNRAVVVQIGEGGDPEYISHVARVTAVPQFNGNLYKTTLFPPTLLKKLIDARSKACVSDVPTIDSAFAFVNSLPSLKNRIPEMSVVMDPYGRAQALFLSELILLPFKPTSQIPTFLENRVTGYADIPDEELPYKGDMLDFLEEAVRFHHGFEYAHDIGNNDGKIVELITASGLRIPVQADEWTDNFNEIVETTKNAGEDALVWGDPDPKIQKQTRAITYEAEVFDFLLYQLSHDIHTGEDYRALRIMLGQNTPKLAELKPLLQTWIDETLTFHEADKPPAFVKKMRSPCSTGNCEGSLCYQDGDSCKVEIKMVRENLNKTKLEDRLLKTLLTNEKIRDIVWQHKTSPFFSSVLYLEMPSELIMSESQVQKILRGV